MKSFTECNGLEIVAGDLGHLVVSEELSSDGSMTFPVFVYTPNMANVTACHHIELFKDEAQALHDWLGKYLKKT